LLGELDFAVLSVDLALVRSRWHGSTRPDELVLVACSTVKRGPAPERTKPRGQTWGFGGARGELNRHDPKLRILKSGHLSVDRRSRCLPLGTVPGRPCYPG
jgi:hypothetical protein